MASSSQTVKVPNGTISTSILIEYFRIFPWGKFHKHGVNVRQLSGFKWRKLQICVVGTWRVCVYIYRYRCMMYIYIYVYTTIYRHPPLGSVFLPFLKKLFFWFGGSFLDLATVSAAAWSITCIGTCAWRIWIWFTYFFCWTCLAFQSHGLLQQDWLMR